MPRENADQIAARAAREKRADERAARAERKKWRPWFIPGFVIAAGAMLVASVCLFANGATDGGKWCIIAVPVLLAPVVRWLTPPSGSSATRPDDK